MEEKTNKKEKPSEEKQNKKTLLIVIMVLLIGIFIEYMIWGINITTDNEEKDVSEAVVCTMDVKICPDGSAVSRIPPDCDFSECPRGIK